MFPKTKRLKIPFFGKLASKRCFITSQRDWAFDEQVWASPKLHLETIKHYLQEDKTKIFSGIDFHWHRERFFHLWIAINIWSLGDHVRYSKLVNVHRAILKTKLLSEKLLPLQFTVENIVWIFLNTRKNWCEWFSQSKNHIWRKVSVAEKNYSLKTSIVRQIKSKMWFYSFDL